MESERIAEMFAAAGHATRLETLRLLAQSTDGLAAGEIARRLDVVQNTLSPHLKRLASADLVELSRVGTTITYRLKRETFASLTAFLGSF